jgi:hypothetical protein
MNKIKYIIYLFALWSISYSATAQLCNSQRYQQEIFNSQVTQDILFATADPNRMMHRFFWICWSSFYTSPFLTSAF